MMVTMPACSRPRDATRWGALGGWLVLVWMPLALGAGCKVTGDRVKEWAEQGDTHRLSRVVADSKQSLEVRREAAQALVRLERFYDLERSLDKASVPDRHKITDFLVGRLIGLVKKNDGDEAAVARVLQGGGPRGLGGERDQGHNEEPDTRRLASSAGAG